MIGRSLILRLVGLTLLLFSTSFATSSAWAAPKVSLQVRDTEIAEVIEMIAAQHNINILMSGDVAGTVSLSLHETPLDKALASIANAGGYALEKHGQNYFIVPHDQVGNYQNGNLTTVKVYEVDYVDGEKVKDVIEDHISLYGSVSFIAERNILIVQDTREFLYKIDRLMQQIDKRPRQVMIEARILEVTLNEDEQLGIDWSNLFRSNGGQGSFGVTGNTSGTGEGFFFDLVTPDIEVALSALQDEGRLQTLSTPKLVALENEEASVVIGDRRGYQVTTTINQVTTESIEFLESGVILRVLAQIDDDGRVLMRVHPEVSTGTVDANGIPSQTTTEVTTNILVPSGETIFIGGLMKQTESIRRKSVPVVNRVPLVRRLFSGTESAQLTTETIVLIRPIIAEDLQENWNVREIETTEQIEIPAPVLEPWVSQKPVTPPPVEDRAMDATSDALLASRSQHTETACAPSELLFCYATHCACEHAP